MLVYPRLTQALRAFSGEAGEGSVATAWDVDIVRQKNAKTKRERYSNFDRAVSVPEEQKLAVDTLDICVLNTHQRAHKTQQT